ncbi:MAG: MoaD/ThiS family protein [Betaproteobacteria bacterium]|nr:MoaD/ThiS family protein [Betaproteobacteria bacterium]
MSQQITILYFGHLVDMVFRESEVMFLPRTVSDIKGLMEHLSRRGENWPVMFDTHKDRLKITVNKQFAEYDTPLKGGDEVAFVAFQMN